MVLPRASTLRELEWGFPHWIWRLPLITKYEYENFPPQNVKCEYKEKNRTPSINIKDFPLSSTAKYVHEKNRHPKKWIWIWKSQRAKKITICVGNFWGNEIWFFILAWNVFFFFFDLSRIKTSFQIQMHLLAHMWYMRWAPEHLYTFLSDSTTD